MPATQGRKGKHWGHSGGRRSPEKAGHKTVVVSAEKARQWEGKQVYNLQS